jgi:hypothetical protein
VARSKTNEFDSNSSNLKQINAVVQKNSKRSSSNRTHETCRMSQAAGNEQQAQLTIKLVGARSNKQYYIHVLEGHIRVD